MYSQKERDLIVLEVGDLWAEIYNSYMGQVMVVDRDLGIEVVFVRPGAMYVRKPIVKYSAWVAQRVKFNEVTPLYVQNLVDRFQGIGVAYQKALKKCAEALDKGVSRIGFKNHKHQRYILCLDKKGDLPGCAYPGGGSVAWATNVLYRMVEEGYMPGDVRKDDLDVGFASLSVGCGAEQPLGSML